MGFRAWIVAEGGDTQRPGIWNDVRGAIEGFFFFLVCRWRGVALHDAANGADPRAPNAAVCLAAFSASIGVDHILCRQGIHADLGPFFGRTVPALRISTPDALGGGALHWRCSFGGRLSRRAGNARQNRFLERFYTSFADLLPMQWRAPPAATREARQYPRSKVLKNRPPARVTARSSTAPDDSASAVFANRCALDARPPFQRRKPQPAFAGRIQWHLAALHKRVGRRRGLL